MPAKEENPPNTPAIQPQLTTKQQTCPHPHTAIIRLIDGITICHACYGLLAENRSVIKEDSPAPGVSAA